MIDPQRTRAALDAMEQELARSMQGLRVEDHPAPCYLSYQLRARRGYRVWGRYGSVFDRLEIDDTTLHADLRVGTYDADQTLDGRLEDRDEDPRWHDWTGAPSDLDPFGLRYSLWRLTQARHREAVQDFYEKKKIALDERLETEAPSLRRGTALQLEQPIGGLHGSLAAAEDFVRRTSALFRKYPRIDDPLVEFKEVLQTRLFVNSEGSRVTTQERFLQVYMQGEMLAVDGAAQDSFRTFYVRDPEELPDDAALEAAIDAMHEDLVELEHAEPMEPHAGPALLDGSAAGVLFHEAIGHRLEGERLLSRTEGHTFANKVGQRVLPRGIDVYDDPTLERIGERSLYGSYAVDDEGTPARRVHLIEDGVLRHFLTSRNGVPHEDGSNGHGRVTHKHEAMARMANLVVEAREPLPRAALEERWMQAVDEAEQDFGIHVAAAESGETTTSSDGYDFQAFQVTPTAVYRVDATSGARTRVRDVSFVGTPLAAIQGVVALGDDPHVDNSYCKAESGSVPVGTVSPSALLREIEVQRSTRTRHRESTLELPPRS